MGERHLISREIGIDMGHRVTYHGSKCRNLHGHRYTIQAICEGPLFTEGEQQGMVLDFGFLKELMILHIDKPCDHGMCLWYEDPLLVELFLTEEQRIELQTRDRAKPWELVGRGGKLYVIPFVPTAENLARHWFQRLAPAVKERSDGQADLVAVKVWETPNCTATYPAEWKDAQ
jgi:6-pyruvoyltetrahydropterin/6-carboxytetrahydropterin synthase